MLRIRLTRTGKNQQPSYRIVVAEHSAPIQSKFIEIIGHYNLSRNPRELVVNQERVKHWISVGAKPSDTMATLLKKLGMDNMDQYIKPRTLQRKKKKGGEKASTEAPAPTPKQETPPEKTEKIETSEQPEASKNEEQ